MPFRAPLASQQPAVLARARSPSPARSSPSAAPSPSRSTSASAPPARPRTTTATLRLPAPPPPPKPLYLSTRGRRTRPVGLSAGDEDGRGGAGKGGIRERGYEGPAGPGARRARGALPRWSVAEEPPAPVEEREDEDEDEAAATATVKGAAPTKDDTDAEEHREKREARAALEALFAPSSSAASPSSPTRLDPPAARESSSTSTTSSNFSSAYRTPVGTLKARGTASTLRFRDRESGRLSIYFDTAQENPFVPPPPPSSSPALDAAAVDAAAAPPAPAAAPLLELPLAPAQLALALHAFAGESAFGELSFAQGAALRVEVEDVGGGWSLGSLGWREEEGEEGRGLVPRGWYAYVDGEHEASRPAPVQRSAPSLDTASSSPSVLGPSAPLSRHSLGTDVLPPAVDNAAQPLSPSSTLADLTLASPTLPSSPPPPPSPLAVASSPATPTPATPQPFSRSAAPSPTTPAPPPRARSPSPSRSRSPSSSSSTRSPTTPTSASPTRRPYATRSIGRHLVVSGTEFEPTWGEGAAAHVSGEGATEGAEGVEGSNDGGAGAVAPDKAQERGGVAHEPLESVEGGAPAAAGEEPALDASSGHQDEHHDEAEPATPAATEAVAPPPVRPTSPSAPPRPPPPSGSFLFRLGLVPAAATATSSALSLFLPALGRTSIPGASILAATAAAPAPEHARRVPLARLTSTRRAVAPSAAESRALLVRWIDEGDALDDDELDEGTQRWDVDSGPAWRASAHEAYDVNVREARKVSPLGEAAYVVFEVETTFPAAAAAASEDALGGEGDSGSDSTLIVHRRYSHFQALHTLLSARYCAPLVVVPSLPPGAPLAYGAARFDPALVETRRRELEAWLRRCGRHAVLGTCEEMRGFLALEGDKELMQHLLLTPTSPPAPPLPLFPARVYHPPFNLDLGDAAELVDRFEAHCRAIEAGGGWRAVEEAVRKAREGERAAANDLQLLAHSLVRLTAGSALPPTSLDKLLPPAHSLIDDDEDATEAQQRQQRARAWGVQNEVRALSWREEDDDALGVSKAVQSAAEAIANLANDVDTTARHDLLEAEALLHDEANLLSRHGALIDLHRTLLAQYMRLSSLSISETAPPLEQLGRCETLLNITCAEMARIADERTQVLAEAVKSWLEAQVRKHEQALAHLSYAASHFSPSSLADLALTGPRLRSTLEVRNTPHKYPSLPVAGVYGRAGTSAG